VLLPSSRLWEAVVIDSDCVLSACDAMGRNSFLPWIRRRAPRLLHLQCGISFDLTVSWLSIVL